MSGTGPVAGAVAAFTEQAGAVADWLAAVDETAFAAPSALPGWDLRTLAGHLVLVHRGLGTVLGTRSSDPARTAADFVARYRPAADQIGQATRATAAAHPPADLVAALRETAPLHAAAAGTPARAVLAGPRGPVTAADWVATRLVELVVHADDLSRTLPDREPVPLRRAALAAATRTLVAVLAERAPGRSVELRVPPFAAAQVIAGPRHTRGTPPNVVETDPVTWLRVATGRVTFAEALGTGALRASGSRADLTAHLPLLS